MSKTVSLLSALLCTFIWGTTFIAQDTGMDDIGPFTFNAVRFFVGFLAILPLVFLFEVKKFFQHVVFRLLFTERPLATSKDNIRPNLYLNVHDEVSILIWSISMRSHDHCTVGSYLD